MAKYKVKVSLTDVKTGENLPVGAIVERTVKEVETFEKKYGAQYLKRIKEDSDK